MKTRAPHNGHILQVLLGLLFGLWLAVGFMSGMYHNYAQKKECIETEGWLKGWLWCSTETRNTFAFNMLRGFIWPIELMKAAGSKNSEPQMTQEYFDKSAGGMFFICWGLAMRTNRPDDADAFSKVILAVESKDPVAASMHDDYLYYAGEALIDIEARFGFESYYQTGCADSAKNIKASIRQGMIN